jgi:FtsH-binding integral membrane protein
MRATGGYGAWGGTLGVAGSAPSSEETERFIVRTYNHLFGAVAVFALLLVGLFKSGLAYPIAAAFLGTGWGWAAAMGAFLIIGWLATRTAHMATSKPAQYLALAAYVVAEAIVFVPLMVIANSVAPGAIQSAALVTFAGFAALTGIAFWTRKDFSFLGGVIRWGMILALVAIVASLIFGFTLGTLFSVAMVGLAGAAILYDTSNVLHHFPRDRHVAAALELFASVALMFWYVLRLFISARD